MSAAPPPDVDPDVLPFTPADLPASEAAVNLRLIGIAALVALFVATLPAIVTVLAVKSSQEAQDRADRAARCNAARRNVPIANARNRELVGFLRDAEARALASARTNLPAAEVEALAALRGATLARRFDVALDEVQRGGDTARGRVDALAAARYEERAQRIAGNVTVLASECQS